MFKLVDGCIPHLSFLELMSGETNLAKLLQTMSPELNPGVYVFCTVPVAEPEILARAISSFREKEGFTYILPQSVADQFSMIYETAMAWISLQVHSSLQAVGLTAAVANALAESGISCNVVAAYYHDHLFVPAAEAGRAVEILRKLSERQIPGE